MRSLQIKCGNVVAFVWKNIRVAHIKKMYDDKSGDLYLKSYIELIFGRFGFVSDMI